MGKIMNSKKISLAILSIIVSACGANHAGLLVVNPNLRGVLDAGAITVDPNATPNPSDSPNPTPGSTPLPTGGDWSIAGNLAESIFDLATNILAPDETQIVVNYYDLDHLGPDPALFIRNVHFRYVMSSPGSSAQYALIADHSEFAGSTIECTQGCKTGVLHLQYRGVPNSRLNGTADVKFFRKKVIANRFESATANSTNADELNFLRVLKESQWVGGTVTAYTVIKGFAQPFEVRLETSGQSNSCADETSIVRGRKIGEGREINHVYIRPNYQLHGVIGQAKVFTDGASYVEMCFRDTQVLKRFGAYASGFSSEGGINLCTSGM